MPNFLHRIAKQRSYVDHGVVSGFSLIEMMIVVAILAILAAIAIPIYQKQIMESRRTEAKTTLLDIASREEKYFATNNIYTMQLANLGYSTVNMNGNQLIVPGNGTTYYNVQILSSPAAGSTSASAYTAQAVPEAGTSQANDTGCGTYSITDLGIQGVSGTQTTGCW